MIQTTTRIMSPLVAIKSQLYFLMTTKIANRRRLTCQEGFERGKESLQLYANWHYAVSLISIKKLSFALTAPNSEWVPRLRPRSVANSVHWGFTPPTIPKKLAAPAPVREKHLPWYVRPLHLHHFKKGSGDAVTHQLARKGNSYSPHSANGPQDRHSPYLGDSFGPHSWV